MPNYDFSTLSPTDFEELSRDLLQAHLNVKLEGFRSGRDKGIDLRYSKPADGELLIVQAKHWARSGFAKLKKHLVDVEKQKGIRLTPTRYIVTTSVSFTPAEKDDLFSAMAPLVQSPADIVGREDLNNLLGNRPKIEQQHFKLWLPSTAILRRLLENGVFTQSALEIGEIKRHLSMFVHTPAFDRALTMLDNTGVCMLTGIPGIGKTTTARMLVAYHLNEGFEGIYVAGGTGDAFAAYDSEARQIFFYDDFLGVTSLRERLPKNEDSQLLQLMRACRKNPARKRLVLTTREYLFEQARQQHEILARDAGIEASKSTVELQDYTGGIRAKILVNHLHFNNIEPDVCSEFVSSGLARKTLDHENYNPRIVETMCEMQNARLYDAGDFGKAFISSLDDPTSIWEHAFRNQLTSDAQKLLLVFAMHGSNVSVQGLQTHYRLFRESLGMDLTGYAPRFHASLKELEGNFLTVRRRRNTPFLVYHNPAIEDFTNSELARDYHALKVGLGCFQFEDVLLWISKKLVADHKDAVAAEEIIAAMNRADHSTPFCINDNESGPVMLTTSSREVALAEWIEVLRKFRSLAAVGPSLENAKAHLRDADFSNSDVSEICKLYTTYAKTAARYRSHEIVPAKAVRERLISHCVLPEDFLALMDSFGNDKEEGPDRVREQFEATCLSSVESLVDQASTSDQAYDAIHELQNVAEQLGYGIDDLELSHLHDRANELSEYEDRQADMNEEEYYFARYREREESRAVDDILDSLRDG